MARKLTLDMDALSVSSFTTHTPEEKLGTVNAHARPCPWSQPLSCQATLHTCASFDVSCRAEG